jgi:hypothetical protein
MKDFIDRSYNVDLLGGGRVSDQAWQNSFYVTVSASVNAALRCITACFEDFRPTSLRSAFPSWSSTATRTACCRTRPPAGGFPRC